MIIPTSNTHYVPLHLAMLVYLKDSIDNLPETETETYEQFTIHTLNKNPTSSCSRKSSLPTSLNNVDELNSSEIESLLFHIYSKPLVQWYSE